MTPPRSVEEWAKTCEREGHGIDGSLVVFVICSDCLRVYAAEQVAQACQDHEVKMVKMTQARERALEQVAQARAEDQRVRLLYNEAVTVLLECDHGDEKTCGCRDRAVERLTAIRAQRGDEG